MPLRIQSKFVPIRSVLLLLAALAIFVAARPAQSAQSRAEALDSRVHDARTEQQNIRQLWNSENKTPLHSKVPLTFWNTVDGRIFDELDDRVEQFLGSAEASIRALEYEAAVKDLASVRGWLDTMKTIEQQGLNTPLETIQTESKIEPLLDEMTNPLPVERNPRQIRALLYNENSFVARMFDKAAAHFCPGITGQRPYFPLQQAKERLMVLDDQGCHVMLLAEYQSATRILTACGAPN